MFGTICVGSIMCIFLLVVAEPVKGMPRLLPQGILLSRVECSSF